MSVATPDIVDDVETTEKTELKEPSMYKVIFHNDDVTPFDFVMEILYEIYNKTAEEALEITRLVHETGSGIAGVYTKEIAEEKVMETENVVMLSGYPLTVTYEED